MEAYASPEWYAARKSAERWFSYRGFSFYFQRPFLPGEGAFLTPANLETFLRKDRKEFNRDRFFKAARNAGITENGVFFCAQTERMVVVVGENLWTYLKWQDAQKV
jgi:hypothetical protein